MARKTNKTAHVLNLITNSTPNEEDSSIEVPNDGNIAIEVNVDVLDAKDTSENISSPQDSTDKNPALKEPQSKTDTSKSSSNHPQTPVVEILYNEHDPLSDIIKNVLEETSEEQPLATESIKNDTNISDDSSITSANVFEYNLEFDEDGNEITSENISYNDITVNNDTSVDTADTSEIESGPSYKENTDLEKATNNIESPLNDSNIMDSKEDLTIESAIESALETSMEHEPSNSSSLLEKLETAKNNHLHDRTDLNSMIDLDFKYVNVYERIVQGKLLDYMKKFDMCMCDRCIVDTFALAVTELPTKIVVVDKNEVFPLVNFFEVKNTAIISTALIKACMIVKEKPHHK